MPENTDEHREAIWRLLAEFTLPADRETPDRVMELVATTTELRLPEARLRQVREVVAETLAHHTNQQAILIRLFSALPAGPTPDSALPAQGWGLFSIHQLPASEAASVTSLLILEIYFYTEARK